MSAGPNLHDLAGVIHVHSLHSDGTGTVAQIAAAARHAGLDYVLLTDHDTLAAKERGEEGWYGSVLMLAGEEVSPEHGNHYLAFGLDRPIDHRGLDPQEIVERVREAGGFGFLAHPFSQGVGLFRFSAAGMPWRELEIPGYTGLELWSFVTDTAEQLRGLRDTARFVLTPGRFVDHPTRRNLHLWDDLCAHRRCVAIGGLDAHQIGLRVGGRVPLRLMAYRRSFRYLRTHVLVDQRPLRELKADRQAVYAALRAGHAYMAMDSLAPARGFRFWAEGARTLAMGEEAQAGGGEWLLHVRLPQAARVRIMHDGHQTAADDEATSFQHQARGPGVYRVEAYLQAHGRQRTWILSNPIYLR